VKLLLDEHLRLPIARLLRDRGHDVVAVLERPDLIGALDEHAWRIAIAEGRTVVTENARDFVPATRATNAAGRAHPGLVLLSPKTVMRSRDATGFLVEALHRLAMTNPGDAFSDRVTWIEPPADEAELRLPSG
jgi:predicted nuclease of predicted toxin-antitoxin system